MKNIRKILETEVNKDIVRTEVSYCSDAAPMVLLCPGFPGTQKYRDLLERLFVEGVSTALIKYRGTEDSSGEFSFPGAIYDIQRTIDSLRNKFPHDKKKFGMIGYSYGGLFSINVAKEDPRIETLVCISPVIDLEKFLSDNNMPAFFDDSLALARGRPAQWLYEQKELSALHNPVGNFIFLDPRVTFQEQFPSDGGTLEPKTLIEYSGIKNLLVVHGSTDKEVPMKHGKRLFDLAKAKKKFLLVEDADHAYSNPNPRTKMIDAVTQYIKETL